MRNERLCVANALNDHRGSVFGAESDCISEGNLSCGGYRIRTGSYELLYRGLPESDESTQLYCRIGGSYMSYACIRGVGYALLGDCFARFSKAGPPLSKNKYNIPKGRGSRVYALAITARLIAPQGGFFGNWNRSFH